MSEIFFHPDTDRTESGVLQYRQRQSRTEDLLCRVGGVGECRRPTGMVLPNSRGYRLVRGISWSRGWRYGTGTPVSAPPPLAAGKKNVVTGMKPGDGAREPAAAGEF